MKFEKANVFNFEGAFRGMRNPMNSWDKSDSDVAFHVVENFAPDDPMQDKYWEWNDKYNLNIKIGKNDLDLAQRLIKGGSEHRKFLRQIFVTIDITAPMFWWSEMDTYKLGTVANSTSKMHKIASTPITIDCFETDDMDKKWLKSTGVEATCDTWINDNIILFLETLRQKYLETKDKRYWKELIRWLPESWLQKRTWSANYEVLRNIVHQRANHKLSEWHQFIDFVKTLPYAEELIFYEN